MTKTENFYKELDMLLQDVINEIKAFVISKGGSVEYSAWVFNNKVKRIYVDEYNYIHFEIVGNDSISLYDCEIYDLLVCHECLCNLN